MSAYACEPNKGSEPEVGWRWALEMAKYYQIVVVTRSNNKPVIEAYLSSRPNEAKNVNFRYFDLGSWWLGSKRIFGLHKLYYMVWQWKVRGLIKDLASSENTRLVHFVTFASFRYPVFLRGLGIPVVWGPVGGGEMAPWSLLRHRLHFPATMKEIFRNIVTWISSKCVKRVCPIGDASGVALASTPSTQRILQKNGIFCDLMPTIGIDKSQKNSNGDMSPPHEGMRYLYVGRLVLLKGVHLLLEAFRKANVPNATLTIIGDGSERVWLEKLAQKLGLTSSVSFKGQIAKDKLVDYYENNHVLLCPSLYESGGYTVLEAFTHHRPAIVLDVGGPALSVDETCGIKVSVDSGENVVQGLAAAMQFYADNPDMVIKHGVAGNRKVNDCYTWPMKGEAMNRIYKGLTS